MPLLPDINLGALGGDDSQVKIDSLVKQLNEWGRLISNEDRTKIIKDDAGVQRFLQGFNQGGFNNNVGLKISQEGKDVLTAADSELVFNSDNNLFKIVQTGSATMNADATVSGAGSTIVTTIPHNLGFVPAALIYTLTSAGDYVPLPAVSSYTTSGGNVLFNQFITSSIDDTNLYIKFFPGGATDYGEYEFKYYLIQETAAP